MVIEQVWKIHLLVINVRYLANILVLQCKLHSLHHWEIIWIWKRWQWYTYSWSNSWKRQNRDKMDAHPSDCLSLWSKWQIRVDDEYMAEKENRVVGNKFLPLHRLYKRPDYNYSKLTLIILFWNKTLLKSLPHILIII